MKDNEQNLMTKADLQIEGELKMHKHRQSLCNLLDFYFLEVEMRFYSDFICVWVLQDNAR